MHAHEPIIVPVTRNSTATDASRVQATIPLDAPSHFGVHSLGSLIREGDEISGAGAGHGYRTAMIARFLARRLIADTEERELDDLEIAARTHEVGRVFSPAEPIAVQAQQAAVFLQSTGGHALSVHVLQLKEMPDEMREVAGPRLARFAIALHLDDLAQLLTAMISA